MSKIVFLCGKSESSNFVYNALAKEFKFEAIMQEDKIIRAVLIKSRIKRLGFLKVINQLFFQVFIMRILTSFSKNRINQLKDIYKLDGTSLPLNTHHVFSVNSNECLDLLTEIQPNIVIVNGTRIISKKILNCSNAIFINTHVGITPKYRGVHGAYWALVNNDVDNCGVTIHKIDEGIDTGDVIKQDVISIKNTDNFITYPYHQVGKAINLLKSTIEEFNQQTLKFEKHEGVSNLWYHPTFTGYLYNRFKSGIK